MTTTPHAASDAGASGPFAARRITVRTGGRVRHHVLGRGAQIAAAGGLALLVGWSAASAVALVAASADREALAARVEALETAREDAVAALAARHDAAMAAARRATREEMAALTAERDALAAEAEDARARLATLSRELTERQVRLMDAADAEAELGLALDALRARLREAVEARESAEVRRVRLERDLAEAERRAEAAGAAESDWTETIAAVTEALERTAAERDVAEARRAEAEAELAEMLGEEARAAEARARLYDRLEDAVEAGLGDLERALSRAGLDPDTLVEELRGAYAGEGGPFLPISADGPEAAAGAAAAADAARVAALLGGLERASLMRVAAAKLPLARPVRAAHRFTSGFGARRDPIRGVMRMHTGADFAASRGTPIHATGDGVVIFAGWQSGYGRVVKIRHAFGFETVYAHLDKARVAVGERVAQGERIGDMGRSGRTTGVHLHYEIRVNGRPVNPAKYIEAARNVL